MAILIKNLRFEDCKDEDGNYRTILMLPGKAVMDLGGDVMDPGGEKLGVYRAIEVDDEEVQEHKD